MQVTKYFFSDISTPEVSLALEESLFNDKDLNFILLYRNSDSVILGKHQNAWAESNSKFLHSNNIPLVRRFSGGGAVFHDMGNINFSFISTGETVKVIDFKKFALPVVEFLNSLGIPAELSSRNDIMVEGRKVSGHAAHAKNKRALHHGTLLFDSDLSKLSEALRTNGIEYRGHAVKSVRSKVANLRPYLKNDMKIEEFQQRLADYLCDVFGVKESLDTSSIDMAEVENLAHSKYRSYEWNWQYSPPFEFDLNEVIRDKQFSATVRVRKGVIEDIVAGEGDEIGKLMLNLIGIRFESMSISEKLKNTFTAEETRFLISKMI